MADDHAGAGSRDRLRNRVVAVVGPDASNLFLELFDLPIQIAQAFLVRSAFLRLGGRRRCSGPTRLAPAGSPKSPDRDAASPCSRRLSLIDRASTPSSTRRHTGSTAADREWLRRVIVFGETTVQDKAISYRRPGQSGRSRACDNHKSGAWPWVSFEPSVMFM